jgi:hypothetical protein
MHGRGEKYVYIGKPEGKTSPGKLGVDGRIILNWILKK